MNTQYPNLTNEPLNCEGQRYAMAEILSVIGDNLQECLYIPCPIARTITEAGNDLEGCILEGITDDLCIVEIDPFSPVKNRTIIAIVGD